MQNIFFKKKQFFLKIFCVCVPNAKLHLFLLFSLSCLSQDKYNSCGCKWKPLLVINTFFDRESFSAKLAIPKNLFHKISTCYILVYFSQTVITTFFYYSATRYKVKKNESY